MGVDNLCCHHRLVISGPQAWKRTPARIRKQENHSGGSKRSPRNITRCNRDRLCTTEISENFLPERSRRFFVKLCALQRRAERFLCIECSDAFNTLAKVALEFRSPNGV